MYNRTENTGVKIYHMVIRNRIMRIIVFFDLPVVTSLERKAYANFRKFLIREGFLMMQFSVYSKLALNMTGIELLKKRLHKNLPPQGIVQVLVVTEKQFASIEDFLGHSVSKQLDTTDRLVVF